MLRINPEKTGQTIHAIMRYRDMSVSKVAEKLGVTRIAIYKWFRGENMPTLDNLCNLSDVLRCSMEDLLDVTELED